MYFVGSPFLKEPCREDVEVLIKVAMSEQARKVKHKAIPEWAEGLYYNKGLISEVLVYYDEEAIYFECRGKDDGLVRYTFEIIEGLGIVEKEQHEDSTQ